MSLREVIAARRLVHPVHQGGTNGEPEKSFTNKDVHPVHPVHREKSESEKEGGDNRSVKSQAENFIFIGELGEPVNFPVNTELVEVHPRFTQKIQGEPKPGHSVVHVPRLALASGQHVSFDVELPREHAAAFREFIEQDKSLLPTSSTERLSTAVCCGNCGNFVRDRIGDGSGIGSCPTVNPPGLLWPGTQRHCAKYIPITNPTTGTSTSEARP